MLRRLRSSRLEAWAIHTTLVVHPSRRALHALLRIGGTISSYRVVSTAAEEDDSGGEMTLERIQAKVAEVRSTFRFMNDR